MPFDPLQIFLVENHQDSRTHLSEYLQNRGHVVRTASTMTQTLEQIFESPVDVLICDIGLSDGDGWQLMERLATMRKPLPFAIAVTGYCTSEDREKSRRAGFHRHLVKPFLPEELDALITDAMQQAYPSTDSGQEKDARQSDPARFTLNDRRKPMAS